MKQPSPIESECLSDRLRETITAIYARFPRAMNTDSANMQAKHKLHDSDYCLTLLRHTVTPHLPFLFSSCQIPYMFQLKLSTSHCLCLEG